MHLEFYQTKKEKVSLMYIFKDDYETLDVSTIPLMAPQAKATKAKIRKWDFIRVKSFSTTKEDTNKMKTQPMKWEKRYANHVSFKELISKIYKEFIQLHSKKKGGGMQRF